MVRKKRLAVGMTATALALGAGIGLAGVASATTTVTPTPGTSSTAPADSGVAPFDGKDGRGGHGHGRFGGADAAGLAARLGVEEAEVTDALKAFHDANKPAAGTEQGKPAEGTRPDPSARQAALATSLAAALSLDEAKVTAALEELRTAEQEDRAAALKTRLDQAVTDSTLTQAEADAVTKAVASGVIGGR